jgi:hypothetical protein
LTPNTEWSVLFSAVTTIVVPTILAILVAVVLGRRKAVASGDSDGDSVAFVGGILAAMFTVVFAFYVVFAWQVGSDLSGTADTEADAVIDAYWQADAAPEPNRTAMHELLRDYATTVANDEWAALAAGGTNSRAGEIVRELRVQFTAMPSADDASAVARAQGLRDVRQIDESHRARIGLAGDGDAFNAVLLAGTVLGAVLILAYPLVAGLSAKPLNIVVFGLMALTLGAAVFFSLEMANPLAGPFGVGPGAFESALEQMQPAPAVAG